MKFYKSKFIVVTLFIGALLIFAIPDTFTRGEKMMHLSTSNHVMVVPLPEEISLAGESMPDNINSRESLSREMQVNSFWHSNTLQMLQRSGRFFPVIELILHEEGIPNDFKYLAVIESGLSPALSPAGAAGLWQLMKGTAIDYGLEVNDQIDERYHIMKATRAACAYLKDAKEKFGSWTLAAASYNMGMAGLQKQLSRQKESNYYDLLLNEETKRYVYRILALKYIFKEPRAYGFDILPNDYFLPWDDQIITIDSNINSWGEFAHLYEWSYKELKIHNPWLRDSYLNNSFQKQYEISVPSKNPKLKIKN